MGKVIVGIVAKRMHLQTTRENTFIRDEVKQAIFDNDAIAIGILSADDEIYYVQGDQWQEHFSNAKEKEDLIYQINMCDGIVLQGGTDTDDYECFVAKYAYDNNIPVLAICAGQNNLVRALGGTTYDIPNPGKHYQMDKDYVHNIKIDETSKFYQIVGASEMMVNSRHKKTIDECPLLDKVAFCEDGYADVVESKNKDFYVGVRFHPESLYEKDENMNKIFKAFVKACGEYKNKKRV